jgi:hypothetical protein
MAGVMMLGGGQSGGKGDVAVDVGDGGGAEYSVELWMTAMVIVLDMVVVEEPVM